MSTPQPDLDAYTSGQIDETDLRVLNELSVLYDTVDPVPVGLVDKIAFGITLDSLHAEIAELQRSAELVGVRSQDAASATTITFTSASLTTMVAITPVGAERVRVDGWVAPGAVVDVELRIVGTSLHTETDEHGRFVFEEVPVGLAQFVIRPRGTENPIVTPSIEI